MSGRMATVTNLAEFLLARIAEFLLARIAEDEAAVSDRTQHLTPGGYSYLEQFGDFGDDERWMIEIPAARVLAECDAKRRIVGELRDAAGPEADHTWALEYGDNAQQLAVTTLRLLALPYADHPDYRREWRP